MRHDALICAGIHEPLHVSLGALPRQPDIDVRAWIGVTEEIGIGDLGLWH
jgi:hypothetical protein